jgi:hypothetical protein
MQVPGRGVAVIMRNCAKYLVACSLLLAAAGAAHNVIKAGVVVTPLMTEPGYLQPVRDPTFGTAYMRVTDPGRQMLPDAACRRTYCTHRYSSSQAWNADQTLLVVVNGCDASCALFLDGHSYRPLFRRTIPNECEWHPTDARFMICMAGNEVYTWAPRSDAKTAVVRFAGYHDLQFGPYKGNPSIDGHRLVVRAKTRTGESVAFAYDIRTRTKFPDIALSHLVGRNNYCGISPSGQLVFCSQLKLDETNEEYVFTVGGTEIQHWAENDRPGHGDMTIDANHDDVYVGKSGVSGMVR